MIDITEGFTSISTRGDALDELRAARPPTGARIIVEFKRQTPLAHASVVRVRYDFADDGTLREGIGEALHVRTLVRPGQVAMHYYRLTYWIAAAEVMTCRAGASSRSVSALTTA